MEHGSETLTTKTIHTSFLGHAAHKTLHWALSRLRLALITISTNCCEGIARESLKLNCGTHFARGCEQPHDGPKL